MWGARGPVILWQAANRRNRLEVESPGGLYGTVNEDNLEEAQFTRNQLLMRFPEDLELLENRGSGIRAMICQRQLDLPTYCLS